MKQQDFDKLFADTTKQINGPIEWGKDDDHYPSVEFRAEVISDPKYPIFVKGNYNQLAQTLTYALIHQGYGNFLRRLHNCVSFVIRAALCGCPDASLHDASFQFCLTLLPTAC